MSPKAGTRLRYGALCVRFKRFCKAEAVEEQGMVQELLRRLRAENLCSALYVLDDNGVGEASLIAAMSVAGNAGPLAIKVSELNGKRGVRRACAVFCPPVAEQYGESPGGGVFRCSQ